MIETRGLVKSLGYRPVLRGLDLNVAPGECLVLIGANGAGKTTLLNIVATLSKPDLGTVSVAGCRLPRDAATARQRIGLVAHRPLLYEDLSPLQNMRFFGRMYSVTQAENRIEYLLRQMALWERRDDPVRTLSRGMQQRTAITRALVHDPAVLLLDEPDTGLDQASIATLDQTLRQNLRQGRTVLLTTHNLHHALQWGDRIGVLDRGKLVYEVACAETDVAELSSLWPAAAAQQGYAR